MEHLVVFEKMNWSQIPQQDNPGFDYLMGDRANDRRNACVLVCKLQDHEIESPVGVQYVAIEIPLRGDVISRGKFWHLEHAELFGNALINQ